MQHFAGIFLIWYELPVYCKRKRENRLRIKKKKNLINTCIKLIHTCTCIYTFDSFIQLSSFLFLVWNQLFPVYIENAKTLHMYILIKYNISLLDGFVNVVPINTMNTTTHQVPCTVMSDTTYCYFPLHLCSSLAWEMGL